MGLVKYLGIRHFNQTKRNIQGLKQVKINFHCKNLSFFITEILDKELPSPERTLEDITYYPWSIRNKYYCADVKFLVLKCEKLGTGWDIVKGKRINALLIIFDQTEVSIEKKSLKSLNTIRPRVDGQ